MQVADALTLVQQYYEDVLPVGYKKYFPNQMMAISAFLTYPNLNDSNLEFLANSIDVPPHMPRFENFGQWKAEFRRIYDKFENAKLDNFDKFYKNKYSNFMNIINTLTKYAADLAGDKYRDDILRPIDDSNRSDFIAVESNKSLAELSAYNARCNEQLLTHILNQNLLFLDGVRFKPYADDGYRRYYGPYDDGRSPPKKRPRSKDWDDYDYPSPPPPNVGVSIPAPERGPSTTAGGIGAMGVTTDRLGIGQTSDARDMLRTLLDNTIDSSIVPIRKPLPSSSEDTSNMNSMRKRPRVTESASFANPITNPPNIEELRKRRQKAFDRPPNVMEDSNINANNTNSNNTYINNDHSKTLITTPSLGGGLFNTSFLPTSNPINLNVTIASPAPISTSTQEVVDSDSIKSASQFDGVPTLPDKIPLTQNTLSNDVQMSQEPILNEESSEPIEMRDAPTLPVTTDQPIDADVEIQDQSDASTIPQATIILSNVDLGESARDEYRERSPLVSPAGSQLDLTEEDLEETRLERLQNNRKAKSKSKSDDDADSGIGGSIAPSNYGDDVARPNLLPDSSLSTVPELEDDDDNRSYRSVASEPANTNQNLESRLFPDVTARHKVVDDVYITEYAFTDSVTPAPFATPLVIPKMLINYCTRSQSALCNMLDNVPPSKNRRYRQLIPPEQLSFEYLQGPLPMGLFEEAKLNGTTLDQLCIYWVFVVDRKEEVSLDRYADRAAMCVYPNFRYMGDQLYMGNSLFEPILRQRPADEFFKILAEKDYITTTPPLEEMIFTRGRAPQTTVITMMFDNQPYYGVLVPLTDGSTLFGRCAMVLS